VIPITPQEDMDGQESAATGETVEQPGSGSAASGDGQQGKSQLPRSVLDRISQITRQRREAEARAESESRRAAEQAEENARLRAQLEAAGGDAGTGKGNTAAAPITQRAIEEMADRIADQKITQKQFADQVRVTETAGRKEFEDFDDVVGNFGAVGGIPQPVFLAAGRFENSHQMLYALGNNLDRAAEIFALDPVSQGIELARLSQEVKATHPRTPLTRATEPIERMNGRSAGIEKDPDTMTNDEWYAWREQNLRANRSR
jgi:hypothetical protein